ncbi:TcpD family membrane protein [Clostridium akagii]|uniref:TcpD family membrane protein n=1 Tax=Clostridium akagii TaxID=91623 RepID=UPI00047B4529|nr:TcpD family membrane protein [Clostridium akagii]
MKKIRKMKEKIRGNFSKVVSLILGLCFLVPNYVFAAGPNYGQNFGNYALDQIFWVAVVFIAFALVGCLVKRNVVGIVVTILIGVIVLGIIKDPTGLQSVGTALWNTVKG